LPKWVKNGFRTREDEPVKNVGILKYLAALLDERANRGQPVLLQHVKGHSGDPGNDGADAQANVGATFPPRLDLDWEALEASVHKTIDDLVQATDGQTMTASKRTASTELPPERPTKMPKHSHESTEPGILASLSLKLDPKTETRVSAPSLQPPLAPSHRHSTGKQPTGHVSIDQAISNVPLAPASSTMSQHQPTNSSTANPEGLAASSLHNQDLKLDQATELSGSKSQLKASRISPPLIPVSPDDIDPNVSSDSSSNIGRIPFINTCQIYQDCLLEGEEWAKEIQSL
jgi:hypothetical protein